MTESQGDGEKVTKQRRDRTVLAFTGAAALLALAVNFGITAFNSHKQKRKKKGLFQVDQMLALNIHIQL